MILVESDHDLINGHEYINNEYRSVYVAHNAYKKWTWKYSGWCSYICHIIF